MVQYSAANGQPFNAPQNIVESSISGSWTLVGQEGAPKGRAVRVQGVYWDTCTGGARLQIRDMYRLPGESQYKPGAIWYDAECIGGSDPAIDIFPTYLTLITPFQYFDSVGGNKIIIYGEYV